MSPPNLRETFVETNWGRIRLLVRDGDREAPAAFLVHGSGGEADVWRPVMAEMTGITAIAIDMPGHGGSTAAPLASVVEASRFLEALRSALGYRRVIVVGQSLGGGMAQQYGFDQPQACAGIVVANSAPDFDIVPERLRAIAESWGPTALGYAVGQVSKRASPALKEAARQMIFRRRPDVFIADLVLCNGFDSRPWAGKIAVPVLIVAGYDDTLTVPARSYALLELIGHAEMVVYSPCGHCAMLEQPRRFAAEIEAFAARCR